MANDHGGKRPNTPPPPPRVGQKWASTIAKETARELVRAAITEHWQELLAAQIDNATGIRHFMLRDPDTGQWRRLIDPDEIEAALNAPNAAEGSSFWIYTKDPSVAAFGNLMDRMIDRPREQPQEIITAHSEETLARLDAWKRENRRRRELEELEGAEDEEKPN